MRFNNVGKILSASRMRQQRCEGLFLLFSCSESPISAEYFLPYLLGWFVKRGPCFPGTRATPPFQRKKVEGGGAPRWPRRRRGAWSTGGASSARPPWPS